MELGTKHRELIVNAWVKLGRAPVTARILRRIERALAEALENDAGISPALIARFLADEGAELRHPDVIECDARWREAKLKKFAAYTRNDSTRPLTLGRAESLLTRFENLRQELLTKNDADELQCLRDGALNEKAKAQLLARDLSLSDWVRKEQKEIAEWFSVWLRTPEIFRDWLDLRQRSPEFRETFGPHKT
jgi:hypothetical protein